MPRAAALSPQDIQRRIQQLGAWFQNLDLQGIPTAPEHYLGDYPAAKWRQISPALPPRLDGLTVLDIGCNAGFHALECKRRGARRVMGIDADPHYLAQARFAAEVLELDVEWRHLSVYALSELLAETGGFDYVFFMGVFYHLRYPVYALDLVVKAVRRRLVFQTMLRGAAPSDAPLCNDYSFWLSLPAPN
jgi:tRNA (mo5U34)-methyltransferase